MKALEATNRNLRLEIHKVKADNRGLAVYHKQVRRRSTSIYSPRGIDAR